MNTLKLQWAALAVMVLAACGEAPESDTAEAQEAQEVAEAGILAKTYEVTSADSKLTWVGSKAVGDRHAGTINITDGELSVKDGQIEAGSFMIDMGSLVTTDELDAENKGKLEGHLKSDDFFMVEKYPTAKFEIVSVQPYTADEAPEGDSDYRLADPTHLITGNLTMKDSTKSITFPAKVQVQDEMVKAEAKFNIDRRQWGVNYGTENSVRDKIILPEVNIGIDLMAKG